MSEHWKILLFQEVFSMQIGSVIQDWLQVETMSDGFPIDLKKYNKVSVDPFTQAALTAEQKEQIKANIELCRDAIVFFTACGSASGCVAFPRSFTSIHLYGRCCVSPGNGVISIRIYRICLGIRKRKLTPH
jgi:hypothetical protein